MKATELRIGNYVLFKKSKHPIQFTSFFGLCNTESHGDDFEPIPLTEEWLLKFNAVCQPWGWVLNGIIIRWNITQKTCKYWIELGNGKRIELPFVHTLQNFFALTGEELTLP